MKGKVYKIIFLSIAAAVLITDIVFAVLTGISAASIKAGLSFVPVWFKPYCIAIFVINPLLAILGALYPIFCKK